MKQKTNCLNRTLSCLFFSLLLSTASFGQSKEGAFKKIYLQLGGGIASHNAPFGEFGVQTLLSKNWVATFSYHEIDMEPKNLPADYHPGVAIVFFFPIEESMPSVDLKLYSVTAGKYFKTGRNTWFTTEAGLSLATGKKISFSRNTDPSGWNFLIIGEYPSNYITSEESKTSIGGMLKADINWAFSSIAGLGTGVFANVNSIQSAVGFEVKLTVGWMNRKKNH
jgi:hypothetical protein